MKQQQTLAMATGIERHAKPKRRAEFFAQMNTVVPWRELVGEIEPFYPRSEGPGRPPVELERMPRCIFCSSGSTCRTLRWKRRCTRA